MKVPSDVVSLQAFLDAGVLSPADVHVTATLARAAGIVGSGQAAKNVHLATALAVRAPRQGHVCVDLSVVAETVVADTRVLDHFDGTGDPLSALVWPEPGKWIKQIAKSTELVRSASALDLGAADMARSALVLNGSQLYLDRYFIYETEVARALRARADQAPRTHRLSQPAVIDALFGTDPDNQQCQAALAMSTGALTVVVGGPGTGKTRTIAQALAGEVQASRAAGIDLRVALAAPTGKAASRMGEAIAREVQDTELDPGVAELISAIKPTTIHKLLGYRNGIQFRHDARSPVVHDLVIVDEVSMVSLPLMARLLAAVRPTARLVLVGDPFQLASVEAGAVLGDIVEGQRLRTNIVRLDKVHRFSDTSGIAKLADAVVAGDSPTAIALLESEQDLNWILPTDSSKRARLEHLAASQAAAVVTAAVAGDGEAALARGSEFKVLCGTRHGPLGLRTWQQRIETQAADLAGRSLAGRWYLGRPIIITRNDYLNQLANGDVGVVINTEEGLRVQIAGAEQRLLAPSQLESPETWWAMTIHKSQGSEFAHVAVSLPESPAPILTRELLYTAVTRAKRELTVFASADALRTAIETPVTRTSGLRGLLS